MNRIPGRPKSREGSNPGKAQAAVYNGRAGRDGRERDHEIPSQP